MRWYIPLLFLAFTGCNLNPCCTKETVACEADCPAPTRKKTVCKPEQPEVEVEAPPPIRVKLPPQKIIVEQQQPPPQQLAQQPAAVPQPALVQQQPQYLYAQQPPMMMQQPQMMQAGYAQPPMMMQQQPLMMPQAEIRNRPGFALEWFHLPLPWLRPTTVPVVVQSPQPLMMQAPMMQAQYGYAPQPMMMQQPQMMPQQAMMMQQPQAMPATVSVPVQGTMTMQGQAPVCVPAPQTALPPGMIAIPAARVEDFCKMVEEMKAREKKAQEKEEE